MKRILKEAAHQRMLAEETRLQRWRRGVRDRCYSIGSTLASAISAVGAFLKEKVPPLITGFWKWLKRCWGLVLLAGIVLVLLYSLGSYIYSIETREYLVISGDQCWIVNGVTRSSNGGAYFDTHAGRLYLMDWQIIRTHKGEHNYSEATRILGYPDFDLDSCYREPL